VKNGPHFTDLAKESAVCGAIAVGSFELIAQELLIPSEAFVDPKWRIVYAAACALRSQISDQIVCAESISDFIAWHDLDKEFQTAVDSTKRIHWRKWAEGADTSLAFGPSTRPLEYCLQELGYLYCKRQAANIGSLLADNAMDVESAIAGLQALNSANGSTLPITIKAVMLCEKPPVNPPELIHGILHQGAKMAFGGGSKSFKTWTLLEMAISIATGTPWFGFQTTKSPVLYANFELPDWAIAQRIIDICEAKKLPVPENLTLWNLRGHAADASIILPKIAQLTKEQGFGALFLDPLYKLLGSRDENAAHDMAELMNVLERLALEIKSSVIFGGHYSKGNQSSKEALDRISGSGVFARDPDSIVTMTAHEKDDCYSIEMTLRNLPPQHSFVVRRQHPLMVIDSQLNPANLKKPKHPGGGRPPEHNPDDALNCLTDNMSSTEWEAAAEKADIPRSTFYRLRKMLLQEHRVFQSQIDQKWARKP
jgi:hypothetical protein